MNQGLGRRPTARCLNPKCKFTVSWRHGQKPPKACPLCGYDKSAEDLTRIREKLAEAKKRERVKRTEEALAHEIAELPWWRRWALALGFIKFPRIEAPGFIRVDEIAILEIK